MARLTTLKIKSLSQPGRYGDGGGLMLLVKESGARSWLLRIQANGKRRDIGLGSLKDVPLSEARDKAAELRKLARNGTDPLIAKRAARRPAPSVPTFREAAEMAHEEMKAAWRNAKHREQWLSSLKTYAFPSLGNLPVNAVEAAAIIDALRPIWLAKPETARRVKQRIGTVLDWAYSKGHRPLEAPMRAIGRGMARQPKRDRHFAALAHDQVGSLMTVLSGGETIGRLALRFLILTAARSGEVRGARWDEIDWTDATWTLPAHRMKAGKMHIVPLSNSALAILEAAKEAKTGRPGEFIFPGSGGRPLSDMTLTKALRAATAANATVHGFRSSFRDWAAEETQYRGEVVEAALAHTNGNKVEAAYRRTNFLEKRRKLMEDWDRYLEA